MNVNIMIPFAEQNGKIVHVSEVENGILCNCKCCSCGAQLIAKNNRDNIKESHFAHYNSTDCGKALETSIHKAAKQYLLETKTMVFPHILYYDKSNQVNFEKVELEKTLNYEDSLIIVDAVGYVNNKHKIIIEFAVTHFVSDKKIEILNKLKIPTIEVYLSSSCNSFEEIKNAFQENGFKKWIYYPLQDNKELNTIISKYKSEIAALKSEIKTMTNDNHELEAKTDSLESAGENEMGEKISDSFIGIGWGQVLEKAIKLSINKEYLVDIKTDSHHNYRFVIFNSKTWDKTKANLKVFVDKWYFNKSNL